MSHGNIIIASENIDAIKQNVKNIIIKEISEITSVDINTISENDEFLDYALDSLNFVRLTCAIGDQLNIEIEPEELYNYKTLIVAIHEIANIYNKKEHIRKGELIRKDNSSTALINSRKIKDRLSSSYDWLVETGNIDIIGRVIRGSGKNISSLFSTSTNQQICNLSLYTKQINLGSYNYSGLAADSRVVEENIQALKEYGVTMSGVRLLNGTTDIHRLFEQRIAEFVGSEDAVTYSSGFMANVGIISAFCGEDDIIFSDVLNHQSIVDGIKQSNAKCITYPHNDMVFLEAQISKLDFHQRKFIITDSIFSMDGDEVDLKKLLELKEKYNCFIILDEAHGIGGYGPNLRGLAAKLDLVDKVDIITGSLSKGLPGGVGGFVLGKKKDLEILRFTSNSYIFSASLPPSNLAGLIKALDILSVDNSIEKKLSHNQSFLRYELRKLGLNIPQGETAIIPIIFSDDKAVFALGKKLHEDGVFVNVIRYPAVPKTSPRIRLNITAALTESDLFYSINKFKKALSSLGHI